MSNQESIQKARELLNKMIKDFTGESMCSASVVCRTIDNLNKVLSLLAEPVQKYGVQIWLDNRWTQKNWCESKETAKEIQQQWQNGGYKTRLISPDCQQPPASAFTKEWKKRVERMIEGTGTKESVTKYYWAILEACDLIESLEAEKKELTTSQKEVEYYLEKALAENKELEKAIAKESFEIEQLLAQAIGGYPWYKDDQKNFPNATEKCGVCVGEHVPATLAAEAANKLKKLESQLAKRGEATTFLRTMLEGLPSHWNLNNVDRELKRILGDEDFERIVK